MRKNLAAFTPVEHPYPPYVSINREEDESVSITVRSKSTIDGISGFPKEGGTSIIFMHESELKKLLLNVLDPTAS